mgnify:CR=1 FL=1
MPTKQQERDAAKGPQASKKAGELFLIDGNSLAYRAFFALPESIATHDGRPTNAIYGLASMFAKMLIDHSPAAVVVAWDAGWSGRELTYEPYKAERKPRPDLLREQLNSGIQVAPYQVFVRGRRSSTRNGTHRA